MRKQPILPVSYEGFYVSNQGMSEDVYWRVRNFLEKFSADNQRSSHPAINMEDTLFHRIWEETIYDEELDY